MTSLHPVMSRILALTILLVLLGGIYWFAMAPLVNRFAQLDDAIATQSDLLHRYRALGLSKDTLKQKLTKLRDQDTTNTGALSGGSESLVGAEVQNRLKQFVEQHNGNLGSVQVLQGKEDGDFRKITVRARITGTNEGIHNMLHMIESSPRMLMIESLDLRAQRMRRRKGDTTPPQSLLNLGIDITGYMQGEAK